MARLIWSPRAIRDLEEICDYIANGSEKYAQIFAQRAVQIIESLPDNPNAGSIVPEYDSPRLRERFLHSYRIIYRVKGEDIQLVTICHGARLLDPEIQL